MQKLQKSAQFQLCLTFPGQPCASRERVLSAAKRGEGCAASCGGGQKWLMLPSTARPETDTAKMIGQRRRIKVAARDR